MVHRVTLYSNNILGKSALVYGYVVLGSKAQTTEYLFDDAIPSWEYIPREKRMKLKVIILGVGSHVIPWKGKTIIMTVENTLEGRVISSPHGMEFLKVVNISLGSEPETREEDEKYLNEFVTTAKTYVEEFLDRYRKQENKIKRYVYDEKHNDWEILNIGPQRGFDTIFMDKDVKEDLIKFVREFTNPDIKDEYAKFSIPFKCNILLHGAPGTGKSSTISAIASEVDSDVAIIHFTPSLDDNKFIRALNQLTSLDKCKVLVIEDVDSLFVDRKENDTNKNSVTLSGLLNALDGLSRVEGIMVILTTNHIEAIDHAILRPGRMDYIVEYDYVTRGIAKEMFEFYMPTCVELFDAFYKYIECQNVTPSMLQQFFFHYRKSPMDILKHMDIMQEIIRDKGHKSVFEKNRGNNNNMYM